MPANLVSSVTKVLTPELLDRIASGLGLDRTIIEKASTASVPALLAGLVSLVAKPGGTAKLGDAVAQQQPGVLTNIASAIGGSGQQASINAGASALTSLFGGTTMSALTNAVGQYAGIGAGGSKSLMGLIGPIVMGVLGQQQRASGLDATGLANLLASQKDNIVRALPAGFAKYLGETGILDSPASTVSDYPGSSRPSYAVSPKSKAASLPWGWLIPALALLAFGALAWNQFLRTGPTETAAVLPPTKVEAPMQTPVRTTFIVTEDGAKNWIGRAVYSSDNKKIGDIIEIKRGPDNKVTEAYIDTGTFLGIGGTRYRVTSDQIQEVRPDGLVLTLKESEVKSVPQAAEQKQ
jgi:Bacterial protein of unknown function (DUF937)/PRC-barrel domain